MFLLDGRFTTAGGSSHSHQTVCCSTLGPPTNYSTVTLVLQSSFPEVDRSQRRTVGPAGSSADGMRSSGQNLAGSPGPSPVSHRRIESMGRSVDFKDQEWSSNSLYGVSKQNQAGSPGPSPVSVRRTESMGHRDNFKGQEWRGPQRGPKL